MAIDQLKLQAAQDRYNKRIKTRRKKAKVKEKIGFIMKANEFNNYLFGRGLNE